LPPEPACCDLRQAGGCEQDGFPARSLVCDLAALWHQNEITMNKTVLPSYPVVNFLVRWGAVLTGLLGLVPLAGAGVIVWQGAPPFWLGIGLVGGALLWLIAQSYIEVLRILSDALMPR
jgi:hypothetical protein